MAEPIQFPALPHAKRPPIDGGDGGSHDSGMEARVTRLETDLRDLKSDVKGARLDLAEIKGRLSQMPTTFQLLTWFMTVAVALVGLTFAIAKFVTG